MADNRIDPELVRRLADILRDTDLTEVEVEDGGLKIRVAREPAAVAPMMQAPMSYAAPQQAAPQPLPAGAESVPDGPLPAVAAGETVKSPMVGTVYLSPTPESDAFVAVGQKVTQGQTLLIVEAMKTMNPIPAPRAGTVLEIMVGNEQPVEFGAPLVILE